MAIPKMAANVVGTRLHVSGDIAGVDFPEAMFAIRRSEMRWNVKVWSVEFTG